MRDRLIELIIKSDILCHTCGGNSASYCAEAIADHLLENGIIVPPCKVGDIVYVITTKIPCYACNNCSDFCHKQCGIKDKDRLVVKQAKVYSIELGEINKLYTEIKETKRTRAYNYTWWFDDIGKTVFLSKEEAEQALKGGGEE